jgi:hypothetical protein
MSNMIVAVFLKYNDCVIRVKHTLPSTINTAKVGWWNTILCDLNYYYNEHTCPCNWLKEDSDMINFSDWNIDPHGLFKLYAAIDWRDFETKQVVTKDELREANLQLQHALSQERR